MKIAITKRVSGCTRREGYIKKSALHLLLTTKMKFEFMKNNAAGFRIEKMSQVFRVSRSGYYRFVSAKPSGRSKENHRLLGLIKKVHERSGETYGRPRVYAELSFQGEGCSRKRVARLMKAAGIEAKMKKRFKITTKMNPKSKVAPNLLEQDFKAEAPNQRWVADLRISQPAKVGCMWPLY